MDIALHTQPHSQPTLRDEAGWQDEGALRAHLTLAASTFAHNWEPSPVQLSQPLSNSSKDIETQDNEQWDERQSFKTGKNLQSVSAKWSL